MFVNICDTGSMVLIIQLDQKVVLQEKVNYLFCKVLV